MPKRNITSRGKPSKSTVTLATDAEILATSDAENSAPSDTSDAADALTAAINAVPVVGTTETLGEILAASVALPPTPGDVSPDATPSVIDIVLSDIDSAMPATSVAVPSKPDHKAEFIERKAAATLSALDLYAGQSLSVHRSDKQPAAAAYLERVAKPVQLAKSATSRDDSALLSYYDHLTTYFGGDYLSGFNPDRFGADLGALSRAASLNRVTLTADGLHVQLTPLGISQARNLVAARDKRNAKA